MSSKQETPRAARSQQSSSTLPSTPSLATPVQPPLPPTGLLAGRSPSGNLVPKRTISKPASPQPLPAMSDHNKQQQPRSNGTLHHATGAPHTASASAAHTEPAVANGLSTVAHTPTDPTPSAPTTASPSVPSSPPSPSSHPQPSPSHASMQQPEPTLSSSLRVAAHQQPLLDALTELVHAAGVGHWQGLTTQQRKDVGTQLCREHLFNPQPGNSKDSRTSVQWEAQASWTEYDVWVKCVRTVSPYYQGDTFTTTYTAHFDQVGRLVEFDEKNMKGKKNCVIQ